MEGRFEFVFGQLRDNQHYMHVKFGDIEGSISGLKTGQSRTDAKVDTLNAKVDALPRVLAEMLAKR
jgi:hypothetical protein